MTHFRPTPALVVAFVALLVALGGTAYAAIVITGKNVKNGSLTGADVKDGSLGGSDVRAGAGIKLRYVATAYSQGPKSLASGDAACPRGMYAIGGGVSGYGSDDPKVESVRGEQLVNAGFPLDGDDRDRIPERFVGFVANSSTKKLNFEVDAVCAAASSVSSNFAPVTSGGSVRHVVPRGAVRATRIASRQSR